MKVSIITAAYNSAETIKDCIHSVIKQSYTSIEHIIIDGGSTDGTTEIIKAMALLNKHIYYTSEPDEGIYDALNKGVNIATGDIIGFLHSDDLLADTAGIAAIVNTIETTGCDGVYTDLELVHKQNINTVVRYWKSCNYNPKFLSRGWMPPHPTLYLKKAVYEHYGTYDISYKIAADYDFVLRLFKDDQLVLNYLPLVLTKMRIGGASSKNIKSIILKSKEDFKILKNNNFKSPIYTLVYKNLRKLKQLKIISVLFKI
jgi:glycosyltransferase involved in cell wall biosynthesis